jgi:hypothetical protein
VCPAFNLDGKTNANLAATASLPEARPEDWYLWRRPVPEGIAFRTVFLKTLARLKQSKKVSKIERMLRQMEQLVREYHTTWPALSESYQQDANKLRQLLEEIKHEQVPSTQDGERNADPVLSQVCD